MENQEVSCVQTCANSYLGRKESQREQLGDIERRLNNVRGRLFGNNEAVSDTKASEQISALRKECLTSSLEHDADSTDYLLEAIRDRLDSIEQFI